MLALSAAALFALGWLFVFVTSLNETEILKVLASGEREQPLSLAAQHGAGEQPPSVSIMMSFWAHPFILLTIAMWAIGRGSIAVGTEVERGTLNVDPVATGPRDRRTCFTHVLMTLTGLIVLPLSLALGARLGAHYNFLRVPIDFWTLVKPALNLAALGLPIYGYTLLDFGC